MAAKRILVADDDKNIRTTLTRALEAENRVVEAAADGRRALERIREDDFDLVFLDLKMPGLRGEDVLRQARRHRPDVPVVVITAHGSVEAAVEMLRAGADNFIQKPFSVADVRALAAAMLDREAQAGAQAETYDARIRQARSAIEERHLEAALEHARAAVALRPLRPEAFNLMGVVMQLKMKVGEARKYYRSALTLGHSYAPAQRNLEAISGTPKRLGRFDLG